MRKLLLLCLLLFSVATTQALDVAAVKPVKNVILMIPDGTSLASVSLSRWMQWYQNPDRPNLHIDPYLCGLVRTHSSNAPIGDSAPTTSCYMTGYPSMTGYVSTYPVNSGKDDIYPTDPDRAYQPLATVLEAAKILKDKAVGLVFTCEFPHATPADCSAHSYSRGKYEWIVPQMVHNDLDVVIGGGVSLLNDDMKGYLTGNGYGLFTDDIEGFRHFGGDKMWALFGKISMDYDCDRDPAAQPSLEEMTRKAIEKLSADKEGFFLMVEGSKVDWAAHGNDPVGIISDFLAFDRACGAALEFAEKNGETAVVILPDHGNSGISIGAARCPGYDRLTKDQLFHQLSQYKRTYDWLTGQLYGATPEKARELFAAYAGVELSEDEANALNNCSDYYGSPIPKEQRTNHSTLGGFVNNLLNQKTCIGFTTWGHTGEDVFLAAYHPQGTRPTGLVNNTDINRYLCALFGLTGELDKLTDETFAKHTDVFDGYNYTVVAPEKGEVAPKLLVKKGRKTMEITPYSNLVKVGKKSVKLNSVVVYVDQNNTFYLPRSLAKEL